MHFLATPPRHLRLRVWWRRSALTKQLAAGADPDASPELTLVARTLIGAPRRRRLASALDRVVLAASQGPRPWGPRVPVNRRAIIAARDELVALAARLRDGGPVPVHGVALAAVLVTDAASPLYHFSTGDSLSHLVGQARLRLDGPIV